MEKIITWMPQLLLGARTTIIITIIAVAVGLVLSFFLALGKMSKNPLLNKPCSAYIFFFRGTPLLIQIYFIYFGLPQFNPALTIKSAFVAALIAYTLNSAAYLAENIRAGIQSIDKGQYEAANDLSSDHAADHSAADDQTSDSAGRQRIHYGTERCFTCGYHWSVRFDEGDKSHFVFTGNSPCVYSGYGYLSDYYRFLLIHFQQNGKEILGL